MYQCQELWYICSSDRIIKIMFRKVIYSIVLFMGTFLFQLNSYAQCSMCRASMENSISGDSEQFSAGLNIGILYLFIVPYLLFGIIAYFWFRASKKNAQKVKIRIHSSGKMPQV